MKIETIEVYNYGKLHNLHFQLANLQTIYGPNEAGKTTLINFIRDILFGFEHRQTTHPYAPKDKSQMGGKLTVTTPNGSLVIERVEGKNGGEVTLFDATGKVVPNDRLQQLLGPINRDVYDKLFYFDASAGEEIQKLTTTELEERIRRIGVVGINQWLGLEKEIQTQTGDLYKPRGKKPELNQKLQEHDNLEKEIQRAQTQYPEYLELTESLAQLETDIHSLQQQEATAQQELQQTYKEEQDWDEYQELTDLKQRNLTAQAGYRVSDWNQLQKLQAEIEVLTKNVNQQRKQVTTEQERTLSAQYQFYLQHQHQIDDLNAQLPQYQDQWQRQQNLQEQLKSETMRLQDDELETGGSASKPFTKADAQRVAQLLQQQMQLQNQVQPQTRQAPSPKEQRSPLLLILLGLGLIILGFVLGKFLFMLLGIVGLILIVYGGYLQFQPHTQRFSSVPEKTTPAKLQQVQAELQQIGAKYQITKVDPQLWLTTLQTSIKKRDHQWERVHQLQQQVNQLQEQLNGYLKHWQFLDSEVQLAGQSSEQQLRTVQQWLANLSDERQRQEQLDHRLHTDEQQLTQQAGELRQLQQQMQQELKQRQVQNLTEFKERLEQEQQHEQLRKRQLTLQQKFTPELVSRLQRFKDGAAIQTHSRKLKQQVQELHQQLNQLLQQQTVQQTKLQQISKDGTLAKLRQQQANLETKIVELAKQWLVLQLSHDWIEKVLNEASHGRFPKVQQLAEHYFAILTNQHYQQIRYQQKLEVVTGTGQRFKVQELSRGTMQQLYLALVLALTVSFSDEFPFPIIIDDGFADFDEIRRKHALELLQTLSQTTQIIYFTAQAHLLKVLPATNQIKLE
ncbi:AAA family ATPase [Fructilactobacillus hinvesii]|uniref:AAA family ATPase n=1 Tax=Fructilactobacillus hinvesii TaxID=2940300 RepID=A0ABY5BRM3_9LACO|nr:AAA family ATPase [Fructilactobacillus hinvesii]USS87615.1 AAA family ATPase [Fructilactobacillus hinvesii]